MKPWHYPVVLLLLVVTGCETAAPAPAVVNINSSPLLAAEDLAGKKQQLAAAISETFVTTRDARFAEKGDAQLKGQAFLKTRSGEVRFAAGNTVFLIPDTLFFQAADAGRSVIDLLPDAQKFTWARAVRTTTADGQGNFEFNDIPAGPYLLQTAIYWEESSRIATERRGGTIEKRIAVTPGINERIILTR